VVICLERVADLHMAQLMPLPLTVSCFSKIQIGFTFLVLAHPDSPGQRAVKRVCVCVLPVAVCGRSSILLRCIMSFTSVFVDDINVCTVHIIARGPIYKVSDDSLTIILR